MDQDAFRSLLSAPRPVGASTSSSSGASKAVLGGKAAPKRSGWGLKPKDPSLYEKKRKQEDGQGDDEKGKQPAFKPRSQMKKNGRGESGNHEISQYKDRAQMRREGIDDEYKPVEKLLEDFERRKAEAEAPEDIKKIEATRAYLGGDATHSILVKGLDYALLASRKAELEKEKAQVVDDELEEMMLEASKGKNKAVGGDDQGSKKAEVKDKKFASKFKSIGKKDVVEPVNKKKKKKKVKTESNPEEPLPDIKSLTTNKPNISREVEQADTKPLPVPKLPPATKPELVEPEPSSEDENIFADAGEYDLDVNRVDSESEEEAENPGLTSRLDESASWRSGGDKDMRDSDEGRYRDRSRERDERRKDDSPDRKRSYDDEYDNRYDRRRDEHRRSDGDRYEDRDRYRNERDRDRGFGRDRDRNDRREQGRGRDQDYPRDRYDEREDRRYDRSWDRRYDAGRIYSRDDHRRGGRYDDRYDDRYDNRYDDRYDNRYDDRYDRRRLRDRGDGDRDESDIYDRRRRRDSRDRSPTPRDPLPSSKRHSTPSPSRSPTPPPPKRARERTRSLTPILNFTVPLSPSNSSRGSASGDDDDEAGEGQHLPRHLGPLQPLASSTMADVRGFLASDTAGAKADEQALKKARWRMQQGLPMQEGVDAEMLKRAGKREERAKENREYMLLMNRMKKDEAIGGLGGGKTGKNGE